MTKEEKIRPIRSFVRRQGRITLPQKHALNAYWQQYGLEVQKKIYDWPSIFKRTAPLVLEIGFGMGESLARLAKDNPDTDFIGIEVHRPGIGHCLVLSQKYNLANLKIICADAKDILQAIIPDNSFDKVFLLFPDPWPKNRHHKRRLVQPDFISLLWQKIKVAGTFHLATDWQPYADHMLAVLEANKNWQNCFGEMNFAPHKEQFGTKFERRGEKLGHSIHYLVYQKV